MKFTLLPLRRLCVRTCTPHAFTRILLHTVYKLAVAGNGRRCRRLASPLCAFCMEKSSGSYMRMKCDLPASSYWTQQTATFTQRIGGILIKNIDIYCHDLYVFSIYESIPNRPAESGHQHQATLRPGRILYKYGCSCTQRAQSFVDMMMYAITTYYSIVCDCNNRLL